jgi:TPR repeat protein
MMTPRQLRYRLAADQDLDAALYSLGEMCAPYHTIHGFGVAENNAGTQRWYQVASNQGHPAALFKVADCHEYGYDAVENLAEAIRWYKRTKAAGHTAAEYKLLEFTTFELTQ